MFNIIGRFTVCWNTIDITPYHVSHLTLIRHCETMNFVTLYGRSSPIGHLAALCLDLIRTAFAQPIAYDGKTCHRKLRNEFPHRAADIRSMHA